MSEQHFHCQLALLPDGWSNDCVVAVDENGLISDIHWNAVPEDAIRLPGPVLPGMVNVHSHIHQRLIAGLTGYRAAESDSFWTWREQMYRAVGMLNSEDFRVLSAWAFMELLEGGYTTTGEFHYPHRLGGGDPHDTAMQVVGAADLAGMSLTLLPVWYRYSGFGRQPPSERQQPFVMELAQISELVTGLVRETQDNFHSVGVAPHSLRAIDVADLPDLLEAVEAGPVHLHISEQLAEVDACRRHCGKTPISLLTETVKLDSRWCLIHATHATVSELHAVANSDAIIGLCPTTEADLGDGLFPVRSFTDLGGRIAIGSDSNLVTDAATELRLLEWGQRLTRHERNVLCEPGGHVGRWLWQHAATNGAAALDQPVGSLEVGRRADFVVLDPEHPLVNGLAPDDQLDSFLMAGHNDMIDQVWVGGERRVDGGNHPGRAELDEQVGRLRQRLTEES